MRRPFRFGNRARGLSPGFKSPGLRVAFAPAQGCTVRSIKRVRSTHAADIPGKPPFLLAEMDSPFNGNAFSRIVPFANYRSRERERKSDCVLGTQRSDEILFCALRLNSFDTESRDVFIGILNIEEFSRNTRFLSRFNEISIE